MAPAPILAAPAFIANLAAPTVTAPILTAPTFTPLPPFPSFTRSQYHHMPVNPDLYRLDVADEGDEAVATQPREGNQLLAEPPTASATCEASPPRGPLSFLRLPVQDIRHRPILPSPWGGVPWLINGTSEQVPTAPIAPAAPNPQQNVQHVAPMANMG
jgi:hypothetical protein